MGTFSFRIIRWAASGGVADITWLMGNQSRRSQVDTSEVDTPMKLATWMSSQVGEQEISDTSKLGRYTATTHTEYHTAPNGTVIAVEIVDAVEHTQHGNLAQQAINQLKALNGTEFDSLTLAQLRVFLGVMMAERGWINGQRKVDI